MLEKKISIIILNWNGKEDTLACLDSLAIQEGVDFDIILVDNASTDGSVMAIRQHSSTVTILENNANLGYAEGNNVGLRYGLARGAEYLLVLNNDTVLAADCVTQLVGGLEKYPLAAAVSPKSYYFDKPELVYFAGGLIYPNGLTDHVGRGIQDNLELSESGNTEWLSGCAIMFRSCALAEIGFFEPKYYLLYEDIDWCMRARKTGYDLCFIPSAKIWHKVSASFGNLWSPQYLYYNTRNSCLWIERNFPREQQIYLLYHAVERAFALARGLSEAQVMRKVSFYRAVWWGIFDYISRRFGPNRHSL